MNTEELASHIFPRGVEELCNDGGIFMPPV